MCCVLPSREIIADSIEMMINAQKLDGMKADRRLRQNRSPQ